MLTVPDLPGVPTQVRDDEAAFTREQAEFRSTHRRSWEVDVEEKRRFAKLAPDRDAFVAAIRQRRAAEFAALQVGTGGGAACYRPQEEAPPSLGLARVQGLSQGLPAPSAATVLVLDPRRSMAACGTRAHAAVPERTPTCSSKRLDLQRCMRPESRGPTCCSFTTLEMGANAHNVPVSC